MLYFQEADLLFSFVILTFAAFDISVNFAFSQVTLTQSLAFDFRLSRPPHLFSSCGLSHLGRVTFATNDLGLTALSSFFL